MQWPAIAEREPYSHTHPIAVCGITSEIGSLPADLSSGPPPSAPRIELPGRDYYLLSGRIEAAGESLGRGRWEQSANLWWPEDRSWCVATEIDFNTTYAGGTESLVDDLLAASALEVMRAEISGGVTWDSDHLNR